MCSGILCRKCYFKPSWKCPPPQDGDDEQDSKEDEPDGGKAKKEGSEEGGDDDEDEEEELKIPQPAEATPRKPRAEKLVHRYNPPPIVSMISKHTNGTLNLWNVMFGEKSQFASLLNISHAARSSGHRFRVNGIACHPVLPLLGR